MCGLGGIVDIGRANPSGSNRPVLERMLQQLAHRGPDDETILERSGAALVFTRLALTSPQDGSQPFSSADDQIHLIANGEVYNHKDLEGQFPDLRLKTGSDCEILLWLYQRDGSAFLDQVQGMVSVVVLDLRNRKLVLGRDEFGIKPLFYSVTSSQIVFGSELKTLFTHPEIHPEIMWERALEYPALSFDPVIEDSDPTSWFKGISIVPAGSVMEFSFESGKSTTTLIAPFAADFSSLKTDQDYISAFREILTSSVTACATSDVGVGLFLSGGVDSCAVAALNPNKQMPTFSVQSATMITNGDAPSAWDFAQAHGLPHHQVIFGHSDGPSPAAWINLLSVMETPQAGPEQFYKNELHRYAREWFPEVRGMMLGAAADEYFGGFTTTFSDGVDWSSFLAGLRSMGPSDSIWSVRDVSMLKTGSGSASESDDALYERYLGWKTRDLKQYNLWHEDRTAAAHGTEARVPFLDQRLVALSRAIPSNLRPRLLTDKTILREAMSGILPDRYRLRRKVAFFQDDGYEHTHRLFAGMLQQDSYALVDRAFEGPRIGNYASKEMVKQAIDLLVGSKGFERMDRVLRLVNLGLLDVETFSEVDYSGKSEPLRNSVFIDPEGTTNQFVIADDVIPDRSWSADSILEVGVEALVVRDVSADILFLVYRGQVMFQVDSASKEWKRFLELVDGVSSVECLAAISDWDISDGDGYLEALLGAGLLQVKTISPTALGAAA